MKALASLSYAAAVAAGHGALLDTLWIGFLVFLGTFLALASIDLSIYRALHPTPRSDQCPITPPPRDHQRPL